MVSPITYALGCRGTLGRGAADVRSERKGPNAATHTNVQFHFRFQEEAKTNRCEAVSATMQAN